MDFRERVDDAIILIFRQVTEGIGWATVALLEHDVERAATVIAEETTIDRQCEAVVGMVRDRLASVHPEPDELDVLIALLQIVPELERSGDLAEHIAQRAHKNLGGMLSPNARGLIAQMSDKTVQMWTVAGDAYRDQSRRAAFDLSDIDDELDELAHRLVSDSVLSNLESNTAAEVALLARFYERLGDHAVNLARRVDTMAAPPRHAGLSDAIRRATAVAEPSPMPAGRLRSAVARVGRIRLLPADQNTFLDQLLDAAENAQGCSSDLRALIDNFEDGDDHFERLRQRERHGDDLTAELLRSLHASLLTPYDREDLHALTEGLDDVVDDIFAAASLMRLFRVGELLPELSDLADVLIAMTGELVELIQCLRTRGGARYRLQRIEHLERQGDHIYQRSIGRLFGGGHDALDILKWEDIMKALEHSLNSIEDIGDIVESIIVKTA